MSFNFRIKIADQVVDITSNYESTYIFCKDYLTDSPAGIRVVITEEDIAYEQKIQEKKAVGYSTSYLENLALHRRIATTLLDYDTALFHGSAIAVDGEAFLFCAKSGVGKSTHARLWREYFQEKAIMIDDDKPLLRIAENGTVVYGTPWNGKHKLGNNMAVPLKAIAILKRDKTNHIARLERRDALPMLYQQSFRPNDAVMLQKLMTIINRLNTGVYVYDLGCNMDLESVSISYSGMNS